MSTRSIIARTDRDSFVGVYHHSDGYPSGVGKALWTLHHRHFRGDIKKMLRVLIDEHPGGWSSILHRDFTLPPGWLDPYGYDYEAGDKHPVCYCHGDRDERDGQRTSDMSTDCEWAYAITEETHKMHILKHVGYENDDYMDGKDIWKLVFIVDLKDAEPDWELIQNSVDTDLL